MTGDELIALLRSLSEEQRKLPIGFVNQCSERGETVELIEEVAFQTDKVAGYFEVKYVPEGGAMVLK